MGKINVFFTCHKCGLQSACVTVPERGEGQGIVQWVKVVAQRVATRHAFLSGGCTADKFDLAVPLAKDETSGIGMNAPDVETLTGDLAEKMKSKGAN